MRYSGHEAYVGDYEMHPTFSLKTSRENHTLGKVSHDLKDHITIEFTKVECK
jgi:hypothetical protein